MSLQDDIEEAIHMHGAWKARFRAFLNGKAAIDPGEASAAEACALGTWLQHEGQRLLPAADFREITALHAQFHQVVGEILRQIKQKDFPAVRQALAPDGRFDQASRSLVLALRKAAFHSAGKPAAAGAAPLPADTAAAPAAGPGAAEEGPA